MFSALFRKEWRQLRLVRWGSIAIAAVLPAAFVAGAELARRGASPFGQLGNYSNAELFTDLLPAVVTLGLWPIAALLFAAQAWSGDRAAGTESFLLDRPVTRGRIWRARLAAAAASLLATMLGSSAVVGLVASTWGGGIPGTGWRFAAGGTILALLALAGVAGATAFVASPMPTLLLGALLAAIPAIFAAVLSSAFPIAAIGIVPVGSIVPWLFFPAFVLASIVGLCRGEPAGRGRVRRAAIVLGVAAAVVTAAFLIAAPVVIASATSPHGGPFDTDISPTGRAAALYRGGWERSGVSIVDLGSGTIVHSFAPPTRDVIWHPDGKRLAVVTASGPLGSVTSKQRIEFIDVSGRPFAEPVEISADLVNAAAWRGERLSVMTTHIEGGASAHARVFEIIIVEPSTGRAEVVPFARGARSCGIVGPTAAGDSFAVVVEDDGSKSKNVVSSTRWRAYRLDDKGRPEPEPFAAAAGYPTLWSSLAVSPSGRYFALVGDDGGTQRHVLFDTAINDFLPPSDLPGARRGWVAGDRQVVFARKGNAVKLYLLAAAGPARVLREWEAEKLAMGAEVSPDRQRILVTVMRPIGNPPVQSTVNPPDELWNLPSESHGTDTETAVFDVASGQWSVLDPALSPPRPVGSLSWAGPASLVRTSPGYLEIVNLDGGHERRVLFGKEPAASR